MSVSRNDVEISKGYCTPERGGWEYSFDWKIEAISYNGQDLSLRLYPARINVDRENFYSQLFTSRVYCSEVCIYVYTYTSILCYAKATCKTEKWRKQSSAHTALYWSGRISGLTELRESKFANLVVFVRLLCAASSSCALECVATRQFEVFQALL